MLAASPVLCSQVRVGGLVGSAGGQGDTRTNLQLFESLTITRFLNRAQKLLSEKKYDLAIMMLQTVIEGRAGTWDISEDAPSDPRLGDPRPIASDPKGNDPKAKGPGKPGTDKTPGKPAGAKDKSDPFDEENPARSVYASDDRLYRPVRRLCQQFLAGMPVEGLELFRSKYEVQAQAAYEQAVAHRNLHSLEDISSHWFVTLASGRALLAAGDLMMDEGRFRPAIVAFQTLLEAYPAADRDKVTTERALLVRIAVCFQQLGEGQRAAETLRQVLGSDPNAAVRFLGELVPVKDLLANPLFAKAVVAEPKGKERVLPSVFDGPATSLVPLWEHRFTDPEPYRAPATEKGQQDIVFMGEGGGSLPAPSADSFKPGTTATFAEGELLFLDHYQLRRHEIETGRAVAASADTREPPKPKSGQPRVRTAVYDWSMLKPVVDRELCFYVIGAEKSGTSGGRRPELNTTLLAQNRDTLERVWSSRDIPELSQKDLAFVATPTPVGERLLVPVLDRGAYGVQCLEAATGKPIWRTHVSSGGSEFARAPVVPIVVDAGTAYLLTNAGTVASIDAFTGELHWVRKYEIDHPYRPPPPPPRNVRQNRFVGMGAQYYSDTPVVGFGPSEMIVRDGRIVFAPVGGSVIHCLDSATGEPIWMQARTQAMRYLIGANQKAIYLGGATVTSIDWKSGILLWEAEVPASRLPKFAGRGLVTERWVVIPDERCLMLLPASDGSTWTTVQLTPLRHQDDALRGPFNVYQSGPYLVCAYEGGVEVYVGASAIEAVGQSFDDPVRRAEWLACTGDLAGALLVLEAQILAATGPEKVELGKKALSLMRDQAHALAARGEKAEALAVLDRARSWAKETPLLSHWRVARMDVFRTVQDQAALAAEQVALEQATDAGAR